MEIKTYSVEQEKVATPQDKFYFCIGVDKKVSETGEIYFWANHIEISNAGDMVAFGKNGVPNLVIASKLWSYVHAANVLFGDFCGNIEHWEFPGQIKSIKNGDTREINKSLRYDVLRRDRFSCCACGYSSKDGIKLEIDHIVPVSKGGKTELNNLQTLCFDCNRGKRDK